MGKGWQWQGVCSIQQVLTRCWPRAGRGTEPALRGLVPYLVVENMAHCEFPLLRDLLIR